MRMLVELKTPERVILVSDGTSATGMPDGKYQLGKFEVKVSGGVCRNAEGKLAGSTLTLDRALRNIVALGVPLASALRMVTANPARQIGLGSRKGVLAAGRGRGPGFPRRQAGSCRRDDARRGFHPA